MLGKHVVFKKTVRMGLNFCSKSRTAVKRATEAGAYEFERYGAA